MTTFEVTLRDRTVESIADADAYAQEGPMTTFFRLAPDRRVVDSWAERVASVRTADILVVRRCAGDGAPGETVHTDGVLRVVG